MVKSSMFLSSGHPAPSYLPPHFYEFVHPEGSVYFARKGSPRIVTDSNIYSESVAQQVCYWIDEAISEAKRKDLPLNENVELFLQLQDAECSYYFVDHASRTVFWLEDMETYDIGLPSAASPSHLKVLLEVQFWTHIGNYSMHFGGLKPTDVDEILLVFRHGLGDHLTSRTSTFSYSASDCERIIRLLEAMRDQSHDGRTVATVARFWTAVTYNRFETHYGQQQARLDREMSILEPGCNEIMMTRSLLSFVSLGITESYIQRLESVYVDQVVYERDWEVFMLQTQKGWRNVAYAGVVALFIHAMPFAHPSTHPIAMLSGSMAIFSVLASLLLLGRHEGLQEASATVANDYLSSIHWGRLNFQAAALSFALPRLLVSGSLALIVFQWAMMIYQTADHQYGYVFIAVLGFILLFIRLATLTYSFPSPRIPFLSGLFNKKQKDASALV